jgi:hypothetical protein
VKNAAKHATWAVKYWFKLTSKDNLVCINHGSCKVPTLFNWLELGSKPHSFIWAQISSSIRKITPIKFAKIFSLHTLFFSLDPESRSLPNHRSTFVVFLEILTEPHDLTGRCAYFSRQQPITKTHAVGLNGHY